jgi:hypothetical protein
MMSRQRNIVKALARDGLRTSTSQTFPLYASDSSSFSLAYCRHMELKLSLHGYLVYLPLRIKSLSTRLV